MLADIQRTVYPEDVTCQLHIMAQARESSLVIDRRSNHCTAPQLRSWVLSSSQEIIMHLSSVEEAASGSLTSKGHIVSFRPVLSQ